MNARYRFQDENTGWWDCNDCGAVVSVRSKHDDWHDRVLTVAALTRAFQTP